MPILGKKIRKARKGMELTLDQLARRIGSTKSYVWELENKPKSRPSADKIFKLASALDVTAEYLIDNEKKEPEVTDSDKIFFSKFKKLKPSDKEKVIKISECFLQ